MNVKQRMKDHIKRNRWQYVLITLIFVLGIIMGDYKVTDLEGGVKSQLLTLIDSYLTGEISQGIDGKTILFSSFLNQAKGIIAIWFLGLTVIGMPIILGLVFLKGYSLGFTVGFLVQEKAGIGIVVTILSILPQNLVYLPILIICAVVGVNFSVYIARGKQDRSVPLGGVLVTYTLLILICLCIVFMGAFIEAYLSPWFLSLFI
ncbi:MAG: stage II sporulation protein M [Bacillota bacterium]|nr:stage II sporulation protein M [Bacillota bacterium]